jgi:hypothetical protein
LFSTWHRRDEMTAEGFHRSMLTQRDRFLELVRQPPKMKEAANLAARFKTVEYREEGSDLIQKPTWTQPSASRISTRALLTIRHT